MESNSRMQNATQSALAWGGTTAAITAGVNVYQQKKLLKNPEANLKNVENALKEQNKLLDKIAQDKKAGKATSSFLEFTSKKLVKTLTKSQEAIKEMMKTKKINLKITGKSALIRFGIWGTVGALIAS